MKNTTYDAGNSTMSRSGSTFSLNPTTNVVLDVNCPTRPTSAKCHENQKLQKTKE